MGGMGGIFNMFQRGFGGFPFGGGGMEEEIDSDILEKVEISFKEAYCGVSKKVKFTKVCDCETCKGVGAFSKEYIDTCGECNGQGFVVRQRKVNQFMMTQSQSACNTCNGSGTKIREGKECKECMGKKHAKKETEINLPIPAGIEDEYRLIVRGYGNNVGRNKGDLIVFVRILQPSNDRWERKGQNLYYNLDINLGEALCGFQKSITHLDGRQLIIKSSNVIKPNQTKIIKNEGMAHLNTKKKADLFLRFNVIFPSNEEARPIKKKLKKLLPYVEEEMHIKSIKNSKLCEI